MNDQALRSRPGYLFLSYSKRKREDKYTHISLKIEMFFI